MNRLERECLAGSLVMHTLLLVVVVVASGFASRTKPAAMEEITLLTFIPDVLVDQPISGGGTPQTVPATPPPGLPAAPRTPPPAPEPEPEPPPKVEPRKAVEPAPSPRTPAPQPKPPEPKREPKSEPKAEAPSSPTGERAPAPRKIEPNLKPTTRPADQAKAERERAAKAEAARAEAEAQRLAGIRQQRVDRIVSGLQQNLSGTTSVSVPGTGGATYASYRSYVDLVYRTAWAPLKPREASQRSASVLVRVVIAKDGSIISSRITKPSGNAALDQSVRGALDRVRTIGRPFPEGARDTQREFDISFTLESTGGGG